MGVLNGISGAGLISPYSVGTVSRKYPTKITPSGGAFGIWSFIYGLEVFFLIYQIFWPKQDEALLLHGVGFWFVSACMFNSLWIITFVQGSTAAIWFAALLIIGLLSSICKIYVNTACWRAARPGGIFQALALDVHLSVYAGWVTVATIVNITVALTTVWTAELATASACSIVMLVVALLLNTFIALWSECTLRSHGSGARGTAPPCPQKWRQHRASNWMRKIRLATSLTCRLVRKGHDQSLSAALHTNLISFCTCTGVALFTFAEWE